MHQGKLLIDCLGGHQQPPRPDPSHPHRRRYTPCYQRKRSITKSLWIISGMGMLLAGASPVIVASASLATTFAAFCILDETH